jgi:hypothetical protein
LNAQGAPRSNSTRKSRSLRRIEIIARRRAKKVEAAHVEPAAQFPQFLSMQ